MDILVLGLLAIIVGSEPQGSCPASDPVGGRGGRQRREARAAALTDARTPGRYSAACRTSSFAPRKPPDWRRQSRA